MLRGIRVSLRDMDASFPRSNPFLPIHFGTYIFSPSLLSVGCSVALTGDTIIIANAYQNSNFYPEIDQLSGYKTKSVLCMAVKDENEKTVAVLQALNKIGRTCHLLLLLLLHCIFI